MKRSASSQSGSSPGSRASSSIDNPSWSARLKRRLDRGRELVVAGEGVLELVVGRRLGLVVVALGDEVQVRGTLLVLFESLLDDRPARLVCRPRAS